GEPARIPTSTRLDTPQGVVVPTPSTRSHLTHPVAGESDEWLGYAWLDGCRLFQTSLAQGDSPQGPWPRRGQKWRPGPSFRITPSPRRIARALATAALSGCGTFYLSLPKAGCYTREDRQEENAQDELTGQSRTHTNNCASKRGKDHDTRSWPVFVVADGNHDHPGPGGPAFRPEAAGSGQV